MLLPQLFHSEDLAIACAGIKHNSKNIYDFFFKVNLPGNIYEDINIGNRQIIYVHRVTKMTFIIVENFCVLCR